MNDLNEIMKVLELIELDLKNISDGLNYNSSNDFTTRVAHVLTSCLIDQDKLNAIRILYKMMAWPENKLHSFEEELLNKIR